MNKQEVLLSLTQLYREDPTSQSTAFWKFRELLLFDESEIISISPQDQDSFAVIHNNGLFWQTPNDYHYIQSHTPPFDLVLLRFNSYEEYNSITTETGFQSFLSEYYKVVLFFKLYHQLENITENESHPYHFQEVQSDEVALVSTFINRCYTHISVDVDQVSGWRQSDHFDNTLWLWLIDPVSGDKVALGIAEYDLEISEGSLEWIQVSPEYHGRGIGKILVNELLKKLKTKADFVTVSGEVDNQTNPERLYRTCGFVGESIWGVLRKK